MNNTILEGYTRVSEIIAFFNPQKYKVIHPNLIPLLNAKALDLMKRSGWIEPDVLEKKAHLGTNVHQAIQDYYENIPYLLEGKEAGYFDSFLKWNEKNSMTRLEKQNRAYNEKYKITGELDDLMSLREKLVLVDYKCSFSIDASSWMMQGAFYCWLYNLPLGTEIHFIQLKPDGSDAFPLVFFYDEWLEGMRHLSLMTYRYWNPLIP